MYVANGERADTISLSYSRFMPSLTGWPSHVFFGHGVWGGGALDHYWEMHSIKRLHVQDNAMNITISYVYLSNSKK